jgi:putative FmdB family regulatory protein
MISLPDEPTPLVETFTIAMPIYEYQCPKCGVFEVTQRITETPLKECPTCNADVHRIISHTSFILKGSGWYATDYARSANKGEASAKDGSGNDAPASAVGNGSSTASTSSDSSAKPAADKPASASKPAD